MDTIIYDKLDDIASSVEYNGGGITQLLDNTPVSIDGSTFISTTSTGTICEVTGKGVLFEAVGIVAHSNSNASFKILFDGGENEWTMSTASTGNAHGGYLSYDLFVCGDYFLNADGGLTRIANFRGPQKMITAEELKSGSVSYENSMVTASQHGLIFENGLKIVASGDQTTQVIYKLLD